MRIYSSMPLVCGAALVCAVILGPTKRDSVIGSISAATGVIVRYTDLVRANAYPQTQEVDSSRSTLIDPGGGTAELPGFAKVEFPAGSFHKSRYVTIEATDKPSERGLFKISVGIGSVEHEIRVLTGATEPAKPMTVVVDVPMAFLSNVDSRRAPVLFTRTRYTSPDEIIDEYELLPSRFHLFDQTVEAEIPSYVFEEYQIGRGMQAVIVIAAARLGARDSSATATIPTSGGLIDTPLAWVSFDSAAFEDRREVTVAVTSHEREREIFKVGYRYPPAAHEVRVLTGGVRPATPFEIGARVPDEYLDALPEERIPDLYAKIIAGAEWESHLKYYRLATDYDEERKMVRAEVQPVHFEEYRTGVGFEAVIMIGARLRD
jgi:hypothetical protein